MRCDKCGLQRQRVSAIVNAQERLEGSFSWFPGLAHGYTISGSWSSMVFLLRPVHGTNRRLVLILLSLLAGIVASLAYIKPDRTVFVASTVIFVVLFVFGLLVDSYSQRAQRRYNAWYNSWFCQNCDSVVVNDTEVSVHNFRRFIKRNF